MRGWWTAFIGDKQLNRKAGLILLLALLAGSAGVFFVHLLQVRRNVSGLLEQAKRIEKEGNTGLAVTYLKQYVGLAPDNLDATLAKAKLGMLLGQQARDAGRQRDMRRAYLLLEGVLRNGGESRDDVRLEAARLAWRMRRFRDGNEHAEILLKSTKDPDFNLLRVAARCQVGLRQIEAATELFQLAVRKAPDNASIAFEYAQFLRRRPKFADEANDSVKQALADDVIDELVKRNGNSPAVRLEAAGYFNRFGSPKKALAQLLFALDEKSPSKEVLQLAGKTALSLNDLATARKLFNKGVLVFPGDALMSRGLAEVEVRQGEPREALALLQPTLKELPKDPVELCGLGDLLIDAGAMDNARAIITQLNSKNAAGLAAYLDARLLMNEEKWGEAVKLLDKARTDRQYGTILAKHAYLLIGECQERLLNPDQRLMALGRAVDLDPNWIRAERALVLALIATGREDRKATSRLKRLADKGEPVNEILARQLVARNRRLPKAKRDWTAVNRLLDTMPEDQKTPATKLFQAEVLFLQGKGAEARQLAEAERKRHHEHVAPWLFLVDLMEREAGGAKALDALDEAEREVGKRVDWPLARLDLWLKAGIDEARRQLPKLLDSLEEFKGKDRERLAAALADAYAAVGDYATAQRLWSEVAERSPGNLAVRYSLFEAALLAKKLDQAQRWLGDMKRLEAGAGGAVTAYAEGAMRVALARQGDKSKLAEAKLFLAQAGSLRPSWSQVPLLEGELYELQGQNEKALTKYQTALDRGERQLTILNHVLELMQEQRLFVEANALLARLPEKDLATPEMSRRAVQVTLHLADSEGQNPNAARQKALTMARKLAAGSKDYRDHLLLGQTASAAGSPEEAEKAYRKACELNSAAPEAWKALVLLLAPAQPKRAEAELARARQYLPKEQAALVGAAAYEALAQFQKAEEQLQMLLKARPNDPEALRESAAFYIRQKKTAAAERILRGLTAPATPTGEPLLTWARHNLALLLAGEGSYQRFKDAESLLNQGRRQEEETQEDRIVRARVLATQPAHRAEAIQVIESLANQTNMAKDLRFLLAKLYEANDNWPAAEIQLLKLLRVPEPNPAYLDRYVSGLLRQHKTKLAEFWVEKLAQADPKALRTLELRINVLIAANRNGEAVKLVQSYLGAKDARLDRAAQWLEQLGRPAEAEKTYRAFAAAAKQPEDVLALALYLGRQKKVAEALAICERAWANCRTEAVASASVSVVRTGQAGPSQWQAVEDRIATAMKNTPDSKTLPILLAELYEYGPSPKDSIHLYRALLDQDPQNVAARNRLAFVVALQQGDTTEALKLIKQAIDLAGPLDELLDTRAVVFLKSQKADLALRDLRQAAAQAPTAACYFHLAQARLMASDKIGAGDAWRSAHALGLKATDVHPLERAVYHKLAEEMN